MQRTVRRLAAVAFALVAVSVASAGVSNMLFRIEAENDLGTGFMEFDLNEATYIPSFDLYLWNPSQTFLIQDQWGLNTIAEFQANLTIKASGDPKFSGGFSTVAVGGDTRFNIYVATISFSSPIPASEAAGQASLQLNATDNNGVIDPNKPAVMMSEIADDTGVLRTGYNNFDSLNGPTGTEFVPLMAGLQGGTASSPSGGQTYPGTGQYDDIPVPVNDMTLQIAYDLTAGDTGGGTYSYEILPEPASIGLIGVGLLTLVRRRR